MGYNSDSEFETSVGLCVCLPPIVLMIGYIVLAVNAGIDKGFPTDFYNWAIAVGLFIAIPFAYAFSIIFPIIYGAVGLFVGWIVEEKEIENPILIFLLCLLFDAIATVLIYYIYTHFISSGGDGLPEPPLMKYERF